METTGSLTIRVTTSRASLPVKGATVAITLPEEDGRHTLLSLTVTDKNGLTGPIHLSAPITPANGTQPGGPSPYAFYALWVEHPGYQTVHIREVQIFPHINSVQDITLVPLSAAPLPPESTFGGAQPQPL